MGSLIRKVDNKSQGSYNNNTNKDEEYLEVDSPINNNDNNNKSDRYLIKVKKISNLSRNYSLENDDLQKS